MKDFSPCKEYEDGGFASCVKKILPDNLEGTCIVFCLGLKVLLALMLVRSTLVK